MVRLVINDTKCQCLERCPILIKREIHSFNLLEKSKSEMK